MLIRIIVSCRTLPLKYHTLVICLGLKMKLSQPISMLASLFEALQSFCPCIITKEVLALGTGELLNLAYEGGRYTVTADSCMLPSKLSLQDSVSIKSCMVRTDLTQTQNTYHRIDDPLKMDLNSAFPSFLYFSKSE